MAKPCVIECPHQQDLASVASLILNNYSTFYIYALYGRLGAGKTTLTKEICTLLGVNGNMSSPTFSLVNEYESERGEIIYHLDLYRINTVEELFDIGYEEYLFSGNKCFIEWPDIMEDLLQEKYLEIRIQTDKDTDCRIINITPFEASF